MTKTKMDCVRAGYIVDLRSKVIWTSAEIIAALDHIRDCQEELCSRHKLDLKFMMEGVLAALGRRNDGSPIPEDSLERDRFFLERAPNVTEDERTEIEAALKEGKQIHPEITDSNGQSFWCPVFRLRAAKMIGIGIPYVLLTLRGFIEGPDIERLMRTRI